MKNIKTLNKNKVVLIMPPTNPDGQLEDYDPREPLGILYLSAVLRKNGFQVTLINADMMGYTVDDVVSQIKLSEAKYVGISVVQRSLPSLKLIADNLFELKIKDKPVVIVGGHQPTLTPELFVKEFKGIDIAVIGEGEKVILNIIKTLNEYKALSLVKGICFRQNKKIIITQPEDKINNLDELPFPSRDFLFNALKTSGFTSMITSRGCFGNCSFCGISEYLKRSNGACWRGRSPSNVVDEIEELHKKYGVNVIKFNDDEMFGPGKRGIERVLEICDEIKKRKLKLKLLGYCRVTDVNQDLFLKLKEAGFVQFLIGVESFSQSILDKYRKGVLVEHNIKAIEVLKKLKIDFIPGFMPFNPYTTIDTLLNDLKYMRKYKLYTITPTKSLTIHQGTPIEQDVAKNGGLIKNNPLYGYSDYYVNQKVSKIYYLSKILYLKVTKKLKQLVFEKTKSQNLVAQKRRKVYDKYRLQLWVKETKLLSDLVTLFNSRQLDIIKMKKLIKNYLIKIPLQERKLLKIDVEQIIRLCTGIINSNKMIPLIEKYAWEEEDVEKIFDLS